MIEITMELVTPKKAEAWINLNTVNRSLREGVVEAYAADMKSGNWTACPEPISFCTDNSLADGQHRLFAIIESGCSITFPIARGLTQRDRLNLNTGLGRTLVDNARISGASEDISNSLVSTARAIAYGEPGGAGRLSNAQKLALVEQYREPAAWAVSHVRHLRYLCNAPICAAVGRAYMHERDHDKLLRFCSVLASGMVEGEKESAAVAIRNYLLQHAQNTATGGNWRDTFLKVQNAISYFMAGKKLTVIKSVAEEAYPLSRGARQRKAA